MDVAQSVEYEHTSSRRDQRDSARSKSIAYEYRMRIEVLEVDPECLPTLLRYTIQSSRLDDKATIAGVMHVTRTTQLHDVQFLARRHGRRFKPDASTVKVPAGATLNNDQIDQLRQRHIDRTDPLPVYPEDAQRLLPKEPIAVGAGWVPSKSVLRTLVAEDEGFRGMGAKVERADFRLDGVEDGVASVSGRMRFTGRLRGAHIEIDLTMRPKIEVGSGLFRGNSVQSVTTARPRGYETTWKMRAESTATLTRGTGAAAAAPEGLVPLNFPGPKFKPDGSYEDTRYGFRLKLPPGFVEAPRLVESTTVAAFSNSKGVFIAIAADKAAQLATVERLANLFVLRLADMIPDFEVTKEETVKLPHGNTGRLITASCRGGEQVNLSLILMGTNGRGDDYVLGVNSGAAASEKEVLKTLRASMMTMEAKPGRQPNQGE
jgi:hypothetical protein